MAYIKLEDLQNFPIRIDHYDNENGNEHFVFGIESVIEYAEHLPTADVVEVKHGEWITLEAEIGLYSCSLCGHKILRAECNYCPNCGAKMDGGKTDEQI